MLWPATRFKIYLKVTLVLVVSNFLFSYFYFLGVDTNKVWQDLFLLPTLGLLIFIVSLALISRPHLSRFPESLILAVLHQDYLDTLYQIIRKQILLVSFLLQILVAFVNWGALSGVFADPLSFASYLLWVLVAAVLVSTFYYVYLLWREVFHHQLKNR